jgi:hypothetical protein
MNDNRTSFKLKEWGLRLEFLEQHGINTDHVLSFSITELRGSFVAENWWQDKLKYVFAKIEEEEKGESKKTEPLSLSERVIDRFFSWKN